MSGRIIVALDVSTGEDAEALAKQVAEHVAGFKIGLGLLHREGPQLIGRIGELGPVFADAKLHDIPSQVAAGARSLGAAGARWVTAHASGGVDMLEAATAGLHDANPAAGILAVTVLTSLDQRDLAALGFGAEPGALAGLLAAVAADAGSEGIVSSPRELAAVIEAAPELLRVTPGIRMEPTDDDQARTASPDTAVSAGADLLVVGRPITQSPDPAAAAARIAVLADGVVPG